MAEELRKNCTECGKDLPADAPQGLCPQCLMKLGLPTDSEAIDAVPTVDTGDKPSASATPPGGFEPLKPEELAEQFPQLEILELLGQGGMGVVYKARQKQLDRLVALKVLPPQISQTEAFTERFSREARSLAKLNHPHIVTVHDFGSTEDGLFYFIMEYVDGTDLRHVIQAGELTSEQALAIVPQVCDALQYAHDEGVVHRDIKPENILLDKKGRVKIADFGLARLLDRPPSVYTLTQAGQRMGTPHYMAPEQIEGAHAVDHRADIYSLGVVFYEMLTRELPIGRFAPPSQKVQVDVRLDKVVLKSLEHEPERRYQHASEVKTDVETIAGQDQISMTLAEKVDIVVIHRQVKRLGIGLLIVGLIGFLTWAARFYAMEWLRNVPFDDERAPALLLLRFLDLVGGFSFFTGLFVIAATLPMLWMRSYWLAIVASIAALLPSGPSFLLGLPVGIWALSVLAKPEVKAAFAAKARPKKQNIPEISERPVTPISAKISLAMSIAGIVVPFILLLLVVIYQDKLGSRADTLLFLCVFLALGLELIALGTGIVSRKTPVGKAGLIISIISLALTLFVLTILMPVREGSSKSPPPVEKYEYR